MSDSRWRRSGTLSGASLVSISGWPNCVSPTVYPLLVPSGF